MDISIFDGDFDEDGVGADPGVVFDPTGLRVGNYFQDEVTTPILTPIIFSKKGPFYSVGSVVKGIKKDHVQVDTLQLGVDYIYSPQFNLIKQLLGLDAFSYVVLLDKNKWSEIRLSYHAIGGVVDQVLMAEIGRLGTFDQNDLTVWASLLGDAEAFNKLKIDDLLSQTSNVYILSKQLELISKNLDAPAEWLEYVKQDFDTITLAVQGFQAQIDSFNVTVAQAIDTTLYLLKSDLPTLEEALLGQSVIPRTWNANLIQKAIVGNGLVSSVVHTVIATETLPDSVVGGTVVCNSALAISVTLPIAANVIGKRIEIVNIGAGTVTLVTLPNQIISGSTKSTTVPLLTGNNLTLLSYDANGYVVVGK